MQNYIGIEIGMRNTKIVELEVGEKKTALSACGVFRTPYMAGVQRQIDVTAFWGEAAKIVPLARFHKAGVAVDIPSQNVAMLTVALPKMKIAELSAAAIVEAKRKIIPISSPEHLFETSVGGVDTKKRIEVLVARTEKSQVQRILDLFKGISVHLHPELITPTGCALSRRIPKEYLRKEEDSAFIDIGLGSINFSVFKEGRLVLNRNISYGLGDIVRNFSEQLGLSEEKSLEIVREKGVPETTVDLKDKVALAEEIMRQKYEASLSGAGAGEVNLLELRALWQTHIERLIQEFRRSFSYYKDFSEGRRIEFIYFLGGGSGIKNLVATLSKMIGGKCCAIKPFEGLEVAEGKFSPETLADPSFVSAADLAFCASVHSPGQRMVNFLPRELKRKKLVALRRMVIVAVELFCVLVVGIWAASVFHLNRNLAFSLSRTVGELRKSETVVSKLRNLSIMEERGNALSSQFERLRGERTRFAAPLRELTRMLPPEVVLTRLSVQQGGDPAGNRRDMKDRYTISVEGIINADYETAVEFLEAFKEKLAGARYFSGEVDIPSIRVEQIAVKPGVSGGGRLTDSQERQVVMNLIVK